MSIADLLMLGFFAIWGVGLLALIKSTPKIVLSQNISEAGPVRIIRNVLDDPAVSRTLAYILTYVGASALAVRAWSMHYIGGQYSLVILETTAASAVLLLISLEVIPRVENLHPANYGFSLSPKFLDETIPKKYINPWTNKVEIPGYVSPKTSLIVAIILSLPIALLFQVPLYIMDRGYFPLGFGFLPLELTLPNIFLGVSSAVIEETLYRGLLQTGLIFLNKQTKWTSDQLINILQASIFMGLHPLYLSGLAVRPYLTFNVLVLYMGQAFIIAYFLGLIRTQTDSIIPGLIIHSTINIVGTLMI